MKKGGTIYLQHDVYEVLAVFPGEVVIIKYSGLYVFAINRGNGWELEYPGAPITEEMRTALRELINDSGTLDTTVVDVEKE